MKGVVEVSRSAKSLTPSIDSMDGSIIQSFN